MDPGLRRGDDAASRTLPASVMPAQAGIHPLLRSAVFGAMDPGAQG